MVLIIVSSLELGVPYTRLVILYFYFLHDTLMLYVRKPTSIASQVSSIIQLMIIWYITIIVTINDFTSLF